MFTFKVICLLVLPTVGYCTGGLQFKCKHETDSTVSITINRRANNLDAGHKLIKLTNNACSPQTDPNVLSLTGCPIDTDVTIELVKPNTKQIISAVSVYTLHCKSEGNVLQNLSAVNIGFTQPTAVTQPGVETDWAPQLTLAVSPTGTVVVGQTLTVTITSPVDKYAIAATECSASSTDTIVDPYVLWNSSACIDTDGLFTTDDWQDGTTPHKTEIIHNLQAFRFANSHSLILRCTAKVCTKGKGNECAKSCIVNQNDERKRRRRRDISSETTVLKTTLHVVDSLQAFSASGSGPVLATTSLLSAAVLVYTLVL